jgi:hypothetical protein
MRFDFFRLMQFILNKPVQSNHNWARCDESIPKQITGNHSIFSLDNLLRTFFFTLMLFQLLPAYSQTHVYSEFAPGISWVPPLPLWVSQEGYDKIQFWARYKTEPLKLPLYYSVRVGRCRDNKGWEIEMNHLKIYLKNKPEPIERFSVSHGYNQLFFSRVRHYRLFSKRTGIGVVIAHPESTIRGKTMDENQGIFRKGYYLAGPAFLIGLFRKVEIGKNFYFSISGSVSAAWAHVKVSEGSAGVPVGAVQIQIAPGISFHQKVPPTIH